MESLPNSLLTEISAVSRMDSQALRARYGHFFGENSTRSTASLRSEIIYKLQERHYRKTVGTETFARAVGVGLPERSEPEEPSEVAKLIIGSNWNGREFFHMPPLKERR